METLKQQIKVIAEQQKVLKNQRRTIHIQGERTMEPWKASINHFSNREKLRELYLISGLLKGKSIEVIDKNASKVFNLDKINENVNLLKLEQNGKIIDSSSKYYFISISRCARRPCFSSMVNRQSKPNME